MGNVQAIVTSTSGRFWLSMGFAFLLAVAGLSGLYWAYRPDPTEDTVDVAGIWGRAVWNLGIEPVYPPEEDIAVGDVFAAVSIDRLSGIDVHADAFRNRTMKIWKEDLSKEVASAYSNIYVFPKSPKSVQAPQVNKQGDTTDNSVFALKDHRTDLPIVAFPRITIKNRRSAIVHFDQLWNSISGSGASSSDSDTELSITNTETYGVPYLVAANALVKFCRVDFPIACSDDALRRVLSTRLGPQVFDVVVDKNTGTQQYRMTVEVGLVSRVFLTRSIEMRLAHDKGITGGPRVNAEPTKSSSGTNSPPTGEGKAPHDSSDSERLSERNELALTFDGRTLDRPVVFGLESVRLLPTTSVLRVAHDDSPERAASK
jgi:hypothetical protein